MKKRVADIIIDTLADNGITDAFCVVGGGAMYLNNALGMTKRIKTYFNHHEQACAMSAEGYAKYTQNKPALVCVTTGPGGTNTLTGIMGAYQDSVPIIVISGQVRYDTTVAQTGLNIRRRGEQEFDITNSIKNMTKYSKMVTDPLSIKQEVQKAYDIAMSGRRGPVWLDIPLNVQSATVEEADLYPIESKIEYIEPQKEDFDEVISILKSAKRPCVIAGSAVRSSGLYKEFIEFLNNNVHIPAMGADQTCDVISYDHELCVGPCGGDGSRAGNFVLQNSDVVLVLGCSLGFKQTSFAQENFAPNAKIIMVDVNPDEAKKPGLNIHKFLHSDLKIFFDLCKGVKISATEKWINYGQNLREKFPPFGEVYSEKPEDRVSALEFWKNLTRNIADDAIIALGNSSCVAGGIIFMTQKKEQRVLVNINCGSMGDDLPLAMGAAIAAKRPVYLITGDGSFMMNLQELATVMHNNIPVRMIVFSNDGYGNIRKTCKNYFNGVNVGCSSENLSFPNFEKLADAFNIPFNYLEKTADIQSALNWINKEKSSCLTVVNQKYEDIFYPCIQSRYNEDGTYEKPLLEDMYPFLDRDEFNKYMSISKEEEIKC